MIADTETTGVTLRDRMVELAWVTIDEDLQVLDRVHSLIDPEIPIPPGASGVHGITDADVSGAPTAAEFFQYIYGSRITGDVVLIGHNVAFDKKFLAPYIDHVAGEICTLRLSRVAFPDAPDKKLSTLMYYLGLTRGDKHRAAGDVETTLDLLRKIVEKLGKTLPELVVESAKPIPVTSLPFGKYKGKPLAEVPRSYFKWLLEQDNVDPDVRAAIGALRA